MMNIKRAGRMAQVVEHLASKLKAPSLIPGTEKKKIFFSSSLANIK
jgi:hypothetical protein